MKGNGNITNAMDLVYICIRMEHSIKGYGWMTTNMGVEYRNGVMVVSMKVVIRKERKKGKEYLDGLMGVYIKGNSTITIWKALDYIVGLMVGCIMVSGRQTECMGRAISYLRIINNTLASSIMIKSMGWGLCCFQTVDSIMVISRTTNNMEKLFLLVRQGLKGMGNGQRGKGTDGLYSLMISISNN